MRNKLPALLLPALALGLALLLAACGGVTPDAQPPADVTLPPTSSLQAQGATATATPWVPPTAQAGTPIPGAVATLTAAPPLEKATITLTNKAGEQFVMTVEIADTDEARGLGLMYRPSMDPDAGMLFDFGEDTTASFWMANTILPLSIAFIQADGTIIDIKDMQPLDTTSVGPGAPYRYALETNQGYFRAHNITPGDKVTLPGEQSAVIPGMPSCQCVVENCGTAQ
ncbi:MAG: DUF192 domain-containing protein [Chloroflexota bacterium]|nr:DUF192 domain-containing protein [Chloroflexota bacterium]MDQ5865580.1 DUF192 domain-containing protein [Chloroflexota bacterium]